MKLTVRELQKKDIPLFVEYWQNMSEADLGRMFIDPVKLNTNSNYMESKLLETLNTPLEQRISDPLVWEVDGEAVGFTNMNNIKRGEEAEVHLHMAKPHFRLKGLGRKLFLLSVEQYFKRHSLKKVICQPASQNPYPNGMMRALGIPIAKTYTGTPSLICTEHEVNRYEITREMTKVWKPF